MRGANSDQFGARRVDDRLHEVEDLRAQALGLVDGLDS